MRKFIILNQIDMQLLCEDKPVEIRIDDVPFVLCTDEYYKKEIIKKRRHEWKDR